MALTDFLKPASMGNWADDDVDDSRKWSSRIPELQLRTRARWCVWHYSQQSRLGFAAQWRACPPFPPLLERRASSQQPPSLHQQDHRALCHPDLHTKSLLGMFHSTPQKMTWAASFILSWR